MSHFSGSDLYTSTKPSVTTPFPIFDKAIKETAKPPNIKRTTWMISVRATAFNPPYNEYAKDSIASNTKP